MKSFIKSSLTLIAILMLAVIVTSCASTGGSKGEIQPGEYIGQYDESMTPENSCVIYFSFPGNFEATFKQINPELDIDEQHFDYGLMELRNWTVFKPCKPGSRYMLTKLRGSMGGGFVRYNWDMTFKPNQQVLVIDVPKEPGVYCYNIIIGEDVARAASLGNVYNPPKPDDPDVKYMTGTVKAADSEFRKLYGQTPWYDAYLAKKDKILNP